MKKKIDSFKSPMLSFRASLSPKTLNTEKRTVEAVITSSMPVDRFSWTRGLYQETLSMKPEHVRMERAKTGACPLLNNHGTAILGGIKDLSDVIGVLDKVWTEGEEMKAILRFSDTEDVETIWQKVQQGILKNISIGYRVSAYLDITPEPKKEGEKPIKLLKAVDWELFEGSVVAIPADHTAQMKSLDSFTEQERRAFEAQFNDVVVYKEVSDETEIKSDLVLDGKNLELSAVIAQQTKKEITKMDPIEQAKKDAELAAAKAKEEAEKSKAEAVALAVKEEQERGFEIRKLVKLAKLGDEVADKLISERKSLADAQKEVLNLWSLQEKAPIQSANGAVTVTRDARETFREAVSEAILHRAVPSENKMTEKSRNFVGFSLKELARESLRAQGIESGGLSPLALVEKAMMSTSDLPYILADVMNKQLRKSYEESPKTFPAWAKKGSASDFKEVKRIQASGFPSFKKVLEHGEFKHMSVTESQEKYALSTYGGIIGFTRQMIINDDLNAISKIASGAGAAAAALESDTVYGILTANAALNDGIALFHASHSNLTGTGTVISVASLGIAKALMRKQTGLEGRILNLTPKILIVPAALETIAQQYINQGIVPDAPANTNPFQNQMSLVVEPRLDASSATAWYLAAMNSLIDTVEYAYLDGNEGVYTETQMGYEIDGVQIKARHDFAAKAIDFRGLYKNNGA